MWAEAIPVPRHVDPRRPVQPLRNPGKVLVMFDNIEHGIAVLRNQGKPAVMPSRGGGRCADNHLVPM
jgi:hypothetical protein